MLQATMTMKWVFDLRDSDTYWCTADIGWVTGHSYIVYGPLSAGATTMMYEGAPDFPQPDRFWRLIEKYRVNIFYTSPTAIRAFIKQGDQWPNAHDMSSLRLLGSVGEPINPAAWEWYYRTIGKERCPIVDTWWQTETGAIMIAPMPGAVPMKPGSGTLPLPGVIAEIVDLQGKPVPRQSGRFPDYQTALAEHRSHPLEGSRSLPAGVLGAHRRRVPRGRRRAPRRGWLLLDSRTRRRRDERQRPSVEHHGSGVRPGASIPPSRKQP